MDEGFEGKRQETRGRLHGGGGGGVVVVGGGGGDRVGCAAVRRGASDRRGGIERVIGCSAVGRGESAGEGGEVGGIGDAAFHVAAAAHALFWLLCTVVMARDDDRKGDEIQVPMLEFSRPATSRDLIML